MNNDHWRRSKGMNILLPPHLMLLLEKVAGKEQVEVEEVVLDALEKYLYDYGIRDYDCPSIRPSSQEDSLCTQKIRKLLSEMNG